MKNIDDELEKVHVEEYKEESLKDLYKKQMSEITPPSDLVERTREMMHKENDELSAEDLDNIIAGVPYEQGYTNAEEHPELYRPSKMNLPEADELTEEDLDNYSYENYHKTR